MRLWGFAIHILRRCQDKKINIFYISIWIAKRHKRIIATSSYNLLKVCENPFKSCSQACRKLAKAWLAYARLAFYKPAASLRQAFYKPVTSILQACDKPAANRYEQVNFSLYCTFLKLKKLKNYKIFVYKVEFS